MTDQATDISNFVDPTSGAAGDFALSDATKGIMDDLESGTAFDRSFEGVIGTAQTSLTGALSTVQGLPTQVNGVASDVMAKVQGLDTQISSAISNATSFASHVTSQFDNLADNIDLFASHQGLQNALAGATGCSSMHDFFGSITQEGPSLISGIQANITNLTSNVTQFQQAASDLQTSISATGNQLVTSLQSELTTATGAAQTQIQSLLGQVQTQFATGVASVRSDLVTQAQSLLSGTNLSSLQSKATSMLGLDSSISTGANSINDLAGKIGTSGGGLGDLVTKEQAQLQGAVAKLVTFGQASSIQSLAGSNPCVQTLMGYVGKTSFLSKLG